MVAELCTPQDITGFIESIMPPSKIKNGYVITDSEPHLFQVVCKGKAYLFYYGYFYVRERFNIRKFPLSDGRNPNYADVVISQEAETLLNKYHAETFWDLLDNYSILRNRSDSQNPEWRKAELEENRKIRQKRVHGHVGRRKPLYY